MNNIVETHTTKTIMNKSIEQPAGSNSSTGGHLGWDGRVPAAVKVLRGMLRNVSSSETNTYIYIELNNTTSLVQLVASRQQVVRTCSSHQPNDILHRVLPQVAPGTLNNPRDGSSGEFAPWSFDRFHVIS